MAPSVQLRLYEELNDYVPPEKCKRTFALAFEQGATIADLLILLSIPVESVDLILCNGASVGLSHVLQEGDRLSIYPVFESIDITSVLRLRESPLRVPRFLAGRSLLSLAGLLADRGFDTRVEDDDPAVLCRIAEEEKRMLLVVGDSPPGVVSPTRICRVLSSEAGEQLIEVLTRLDLPT